MKAELAPRRYDRIAPLYDLLQRPMERTPVSWRRRLWAEVRGDRILEAGVGTGRNFPFYPGAADVVAVDVSPRLLARARRRAARMAWTCICGRWTLNPWIYLMAAPIPPWPPLCSVRYPIQCREWEAWGGWSGSPLTVRLFGFNLNQRTVENTRRAELQLERVEDLDQWGIVKLNVAR